MMTLADQSHSAQVLLPYTVTEVAPDAPVFRLPAELTSGELKLTPRVSVPATTAPADGTMLCARPTPADTLPAM